VITALSDLLFVYGTLRKGNVNAMAQYLASHAEFVTDGWFQGRMYRISYYPGVIASEDQTERIYGEVYKLNNPQAMLNILDDYEECADHHDQPAEYKRVYVSITGINGSVYKSVWIYLYQWSVEGKTQISMGDFMHACTFSDRCECVVN
jgi:gamma-glutamylcyclotransferase (GGCT)/AIG2-like uncharacterized protein YtfP